MEKESGKEGKSNQMKLRCYLDTTVQIFQTVSMSLSWPDCANIVFAAAPLLATLFLLQCENIMEISLPLLRRDCTCYHLFCLIANCSQNVNGQVMYVGEPIL